MSEQEITDEDRRNFYRLVEILRQEGVTVEQFTAFLRRCHEKGISIEDDEERFIWELQKFLLKEKLKQRIRKARNILR
jgi:hypothetical protein